MKKVVSIGLGVLLALALALPVAADENRGGGIALAFEELYSVIAGLLTDALQAEVESSESSMPEEQANALAGTPDGPGATAEITPMILPGG